jgi:hypothetical protein
MGHHRSAVLHYRFRIPMYKTQKGCTGKGCWPTHGFAASPGVGPGATVDTLIGYHRVQASSQDNGSGSRLPAGGSSGTTTCPHGSSSGSRLPTRGSSGATTCPRGSGARPPARGSSGAAACHLSSSTHLLAQGSSGAAVCPEEGLCRLQAIKQISPGDPAIMISIGACARISSKALRDKGCSTRSQGVWQAGHSGLSQCRVVQQLWATVRLQPGASAMGHLSATATGLVTQPHSLYR